MDMDYANNNRSPLDVCPPRGDANFAPTGDGQFGGGLAPTISQYRTYDELLRNSENVPLREFQALGSNMPKFADGLFDEPPGPGLRRKRKKLADFTEAEKQARRKLKNRIAAQSARDRKRYETEVQCNNLDRLTEEVERLRRENNSLRVENTSLRSDNSMLRSENKDLREELTDLTKAKRKRYSSPGSDHSSGRGSHSESGPTIRPKQEPTVQYPLYVNTAANGQPQLVQSSTLVYAQPTFPPTNAPTTTVMINRNQATSASSCSSPPVARCELASNASTANVPSTTQLLSARPDPVANSSPVNDSADSLPILQGVNQGASFVAIRPRVELQGRPVQKVVRVQRVARRSSDQQRKRVLSSESQVMQARSMEEQWSMVQAFYTLILTILFNTASTALKHREVKASSNSFNLRLRTVAMMKRIKDATQAAAARSQSEQSLQRNSSNNPGLPPMVLTGLPAPVSIWETANLQEVDPPLQERPAVKQQARDQTNPWPNSSTTPRAPKMPSWMTFSKDSPRKTDLTTAPAVTTSDSSMTTTPTVSSTSSPERKQRHQTLTCPLHLAVTPNCLACQCQNKVNLSAESIVMINMADHMLRQATAMVEQKTKRRLAERRNQARARAGTPPISRQVSTESEVPTTTGASKSVTAPTTFEARSTSTGPM